MTLKPAFNFFNFRLWLLTVVSTIPMILVSQIDPQWLLSQHVEFVDTTIHHKRIHHADVERKMATIKTLPGFEVKTLGQSFLGKNIYLVKVGDGATKVLLWSQMHGDESTATMAIFDIFNFLASPGKLGDLKQKLLEACTLYFIPMLNPDGADLFVRRNAQLIDINRDAVQLQSPEARILKSTRDSLMPDFGFNLHDQHKYHAAGDLKVPASISLLAPAYNPAKEVNAVRQHAMQVAGHIHNTVQTLIPRHVGRYDDEYEPRAFGDNIQKWGTSTILIETGAYPDDPEKQFLRKINFVVLLSALESIAVKSYYTVNLGDYWSIPENKPRLNDFIIKNITLENQGIDYQMDISFNRSEYSGLASIQDMGDLSVYQGYAEWDGTGKKMVPGKVYVKPLRERQLKKMDITKLLQQGYTDIRLKKPISKIEAETYPFNFIKPNEVKNNLIAPGANPSALIYENNHLKYRMVNGMIFPLSVD